MGYLAEQQRKLLIKMMGEEVMGNVTLDLKFTDDRVCRNFLCGTCPHDLFNNTRMDLGPCPRSHSEKLKIEFGAAREAAEKGEGDVALRDLESMRAEYERNVLGFVDECDRRIRAAQRRLEKTPEENNKTTALMREIGEIQTAYDLAMEEVERLGESGEVDASMAELSKAEALKAEKIDKERELQQLTDTSGASGHQKLRVCDICSAYLSVLDSDRRLADHFGGKMHLGYLTLRQTIDTWKQRSASALIPGPGMAPQPGVGLKVNGHAQPDGPMPSSLPARPSAAEDSHGPRDSSRGPAADSRRGDSPATYSGRERDRDRRPDERDRDRDRDGGRSNDRESSKREEGEIEPQQTSRRTGTIRAREAEAI
ncbi:uncharacterized protein L969DRAFT_590211 [Mixia osmundae IAM 14324]|uniref:uncharacterized protein n=1 Tax=Mixia osmundae (strain CBS 9802 / IAM 14324 / JCM 22182 / KY 12970) TaxID=764103 RepID=UPI0004A547D3|nr:uncharacterized protein L969DRAFT_590211 [Mixia osmundae IAM 14324]KEI37632.1 hypothetical protein L969DRAFT_590211 [Mixia osmundae IAM 14324]